MSFLLKIDTFKYNALKDIILRLSPRPVNDHIYIPSTSLRSGLFPISTIDLSASAQEVASAALPALTATSKGHIATLPQIEPGDVVEQPLILMERTSPHLCAHLDTLSQFSCSPKCHIHQSI